MLNIEGSIFLTIFLSIIVEVFPFVLLGIFVSSLLQHFISDHVFQRLIPKNGVVATGVAAVLGFIFPVCECAIIPIVRGMIKKGLPLRLGVVFLITAPIINPLALMSTYVAFGDSWEVPFLRFGMALLVAIIASLILAGIFKNKEVLKHKVVEGHHHALAFKEKVKRSFIHMGDELLNIGKFVIFGALIAATVQTFLSRDVLLGIGENDWLAPAVAMSFAFIISLCSGSDAFIAASFRNFLPFNSILSFMVYGPILDFKNTMLMFAYFKVRFVLWFALIVTVLVFGLTMIMGLVW